MRLGDNPNMSTINHHMRNVRYSQIVVDSLRVQKDLTVAGNIKVGKIEEKDDDEGVSIDGVLIKDGTIGLPKSDLEEVEALVGVALEERIIVEGAIHMTSPVIAESKFTFVGPVTFRDEVHGINVIKPINCDACNEELPGFEWNNLTICMNCVRDCAILFRAKESWAEQNGDPTLLLITRVSALEKKLASLQKLDTPIKREINPTPEFSATNYTQYM
jgi:hypothetical protein